MTVLYPSGPRNDPVAVVLAESPADYRKGTRAALFDRLGTAGFTDIPSEFLLPKASHDSSHEDSHASRHSATYEAMRNAAYEKNLVEHQERRRQSRYHVPVGRPLPTLDWETILQEKNEEVNVQSFLAPLFSRHSNNNEEEDAKLLFLVPRQEHRRAIEEQKKHRHVRRDLNALRQYNEPKHLPDLNKKVPKDFVPQCAYVHMLAPKPPQALSSEV